MSNKIDYEEKFNLSYWRALGTSINGVSFADSVYKRFLDSSQEIRDIFKNHDPEKPKTMLALSLTLAASYRLQGQKDETLDRIAQQHSRSDLNINPGLYDHWLDSILKTVKEYDPECDEHVVEAWRRTLSPAIEFMRSHY